MTATEGERAELECFQSFILKDLALLDLSNGSLEGMLIRLYLTQLRAYLLNTRSPLTGGHVLKIITGKCFNCAPV